MSWLEKLLVNNPLFDWWRVFSMRHILRSVCPTKGPILEIGCGQGTTTLQIAKILPNARIIATDFDEEQVARARKKIKNSRVKIELADASNLKFKNSSFSAVFSFLTYHHVDDWKKALREESRVLKKGGDLYIDDLSLKPFPWLKHFWDYPVPSIFSKAEFLAELKKAGFEIVKTKGSYVFWVHARRTVRP